MVENLKRGDKVITSGGIIGKIEKVVDDEFELKRKHRFGDTPRPPAVSKAEGIGVLHVHYIYKIDDRKDGDYQCQLLVVWKPSVDDAAARSLDRLFNQD